MKVLVFIMATAMSFFAVAHERHYGDMTGTVTEVYDGDTIHVTLDDAPAILGLNIGIRINGIDTPEMHAHCSYEKGLALKAKYLMQKLAPVGSKVELKNMARGKYFRIVADVYSNGVNVGKAELDAGLAHHYGGGTKIPWCPKPS